MKRRAIKTKPRSTTRRASRAVLQPIPGGEIFPALTTGVWSGSIGRLRLYASGLVYAFKAPGNNDNLIGTTDDPNMVRALFLARDNARQIVGYTENAKILWLDY
jgi:hypothetical protein